MRVSPIGASEYHNGNEVGRYGRDISANRTCFIWYHSGLRSIEEPAWAMDINVGHKISVSCESILVVSADSGLYAIDRGKFIAPSGATAESASKEADTFEENTIVLDGREQYVARASDDYVEYFGEPSNHLQGRLWITPESAHGGYHKDKNEA